MKIPTPFKDIKIYLRKPQRAENTCWRICQKPTAVKVVKRNVHLGQIQFLTTHWLWSPHISRDVYSHFQSRKFNATANYHGLYHSLLNLIYLIFAIHHYTVTFFYCNIHMGQNTACSHQIVEHRIGVCIRIQVGIIIANADWIH